RHDLFRGLARDRLLPRDRLQRFGHHALAGLQTTPIRDNDLLAGGDAGQNFGVVRRLDAEPHFADLDAVAGVDRHDGCLIALTIDRLERHHQGRRIMVQGDFGFRIGAGHELTVRVWNIHFGVHRARSAADVDGRSRYFAADGLIDGVHMDAYGIADMDVFDI